MERDIEHIRLLSVFHYVAGGLTALFSCLPIPHLVMGVMVIEGKFGESFHGEAPPEIVGWVFVLSAGLFILLGWAIAVCMLLAGRKLARLRSRSFCLAVAGIECAIMPFGTVLGVFTIMALMRDSVHALFKANRNGRGAGAIPEELLR